MSIKDFQLCEPYLNKFLGINTNCCYCNKELTYKDVFKGNDGIPISINRENNFVCYDCVSKLPHCDYCNKFCEEDELITIEDNNKKYCRYCANEHAYLCFNCQKFYSHKRAYIQMHGACCDDCYLNLEHFVCCCCEEEYLSDRYGTDDMCITCANEKVSNCLNYTFKPQPRFNYMDDERNNIDNNLFMGVELECGGAITYDDVINFINENASTFYYMKRDASIPAYGCEIVTHPATLKYHQNKAQWKKLIKSAKNYGLESDNDHCGIHIHMNRTFFNSNDIVKIDYFINNKSDFWKKIARRESRYSSYVEKSNIEWGRQTTDRHCALNLSNPYTIELRIFKGTLDLDILMAYIEITNHLGYFIKQIGDDFYTKDLVKEFCEYCKKQKSEILNNYFDKVLK